MAVDIRHSRTATLVDGSNPDEIQAADWNDAHPITADGVGILFSDGSTVSETMTLDAGTVTASTPYTFKQTWDNSGVEFSAVSIEIDDGETASGGLFSSKYFAIRVANGSGYADFFRVSSIGIETLGNIRLYASSLSDPPSVDFDAGAASFTLATGGASATYGASSVTVNNGIGSEASFAADGIGVGGGTFFGLPAQTQTQLAQWADVPTSADIADGFSAVGVDTNTGDIYLAANVGGTIYKVQLV